MGDEILPLFIMPQIGSDSNSVILGNKGKVKVRGQYLRNENKKKYDDNYDRIFGRKNNVRNEEKRS